MLIIAGKFYVEADARAGYLQAREQTISNARTADGCLDFSLSADAVEPGRINVYERWESDEQLLRFRGDGEDSEEAAKILDAEVRKYRISATEDP